MPIVARTLWPSLKEMLLQVHFLCFIMNASNIFSLFLQLHLWIIFLLSTSMFLEVDGGFACWFRWFYISGLGDNQSVFEIRQFLYTLYSKKISLVHIQEKQDKNYNFREYSWQSSLMKQYIYIYTYINTHKLYIYIIQSQVSQW